MTTARKTPAQRAADAVEKMEGRVTALFEAVENYSATDRNWEKRQRRAAILIQARRYAASVEAVKRALR